MIHSDLDLEDAREAAIGRMLGGEAAVLWRKDLEWSSGEVIERHVVGIVAGENGPDLFMASSWITWGTEVNVRIHMDIAVNDACRKRLPASGEVSAREFHLHPVGDYDNAAAALFDGTARYLGRTANTAHAVYVARSREDGGFRLSVVTASRNADGGYSAEVEWTERGETLRKWSASEFGATLADDEQDACPGEQNWQEQACPKL